MKAIALFFCITIGIAVQAQSISVQGNVTDSNNQFVPSVSVLFVEAGLVVETDASGSYEATLDEGTYTVEITHAGFETFQQEISVSKEQNTFAFALKSTNSNQDLKDVVVTTTKSRETEVALLKDVRNAEVMKQNLGSEELSRKGISDAKEGLSKITGITFVENRGIFIRGLEDRYNNLLINNLAIPSNNPFKKIIALDLIPTDIVGVMEIYKTFNPNLYGDFAGGTVNMLTPTAKKSQTKINFGIGVVTQNNFSDFLLSSKQNSVGGYFGTKTSIRELSSLYGTKPFGFSLTGQDAIDAFPSGFNVDNIKSPVNSSYGISHYGKISDKLKYFMVANFDNSYEIRKGVQRIFNLGDGNYDNNFYTSQYKYKTQLSGLAGLQYKHNRGSISANVLMLKSTESFLQDQEGYYNNFVDNANSIIRLNQYQDALFTNAQILADYDLTSNKKHQIKAGFSYTKTNLQQPDRNFIRGTKVNSNQVQLNYGDNINFLRQYLNLDGNFHTSSLVEYNWIFGKNEDLKKAHRISVGYNGYSFEMNSTYRFIYARNNSAAVNFVTNINTVDENIQNDLWANNISFKEESTEQYKSRINEFVHASYINIFLKYNEKWEMNFGARAEITQRDIRYRTLGMSLSSPLLSDTSDDIAILPSVNVKYALQENTNLRFSASKTVTRPVLMERFPVEYVNGDNTSELGNKNLVDSDNYNIDLKYELFPTNKELISVTAFAKYLENPIERAFRTSGSSGGQTITYFNAKNALLYGVEIETLFSLSRLSESLSDFSFGMNASLLETNVQVNRNTNNLENSDERDLQGASKWLLNADIRYDFTTKPTQKNTISLIYNIYGDRIYAVGSAGYDHIYEKPFHQLNAVLTSSLSEHWNLKFSVDNIINQNYTVELGQDNASPILEDSYVLRNYKKGTGFSIAATYTF